jgi:hypothetical protein
VARDIPASEPLLFYLPFAKPSLVEDLAPMPGGVQIGAISGLTIHLPEVARLSPALDGLVAAGTLTVEPAREFLVELHQVSGASEIIDVRPKLPLLFHPAADAPTHSRN